MRKVISTEQPKDTIEVDDLTMDPLTLIALKKDIKKWKGIRAGRVLPGNSEADTCTLCQLFSVNCGICILDQCSHPGSYWKQFRNALDVDNVNHDKTKKQYVKDLNKATDNMITYLESKLPESERKHADHSFFRGIITTFNTYLRKIM